MHPAYLNKLIKTLQNHVEKKERKHAQNPVPQESISSNPKLDLSKERAVDFAPRSIAGNVLTQDIMLGITLSLVQMRKMR